MAVRRVNNARITLGVIDGARSLLRSLRRAMKGTMLITLTRTRGGLLCNELMRFSCRLLATPIALWRATAVQREINPRGTSSSLYETKERRIFGFWGEGGRGIYILVEFS